MRVVEVLTSEAPGAIHWLEQLGVEFTRENGGYRLARCGGATRRRLLQVGDRTGHAITTALREAFESGPGTAFPKSPLRELEPTENGWRACCGDEVLEAGSVVLAPRGPRLPPGGGGGGLSAKHPGGAGGGARGPPRARAGGAEPRPPPG